MYRRIATIKRIEEEQQASGSYLQPRQVAERMGTSMDQYQEALVVRSLVSCGA